MNTVKSVYYGWGTLIVAGGGAYFFAKRSINAERAAKAEAEHQKRLRQYNLEQQHITSPSSSSSSQAAPRSVTSELGKKGWSEGGVGAGEAGKPSQEASSDPAPTRHAPEDEEGVVREKSKYEASDVFRSRKGDRFS
ncbi:unnamed protein product [Periconia digitata]|uniref:Uncharacterized protein n=1 Tax=Periconia digitata TaxID=1303443 RepID=A0A9W4U617_9PLEO|nr:unnamed protein product [Periconia digitata]